MTTDEQDIPGTRAPAQPEPAGSTAVEPDERDARYLRLAADFENFKRRKAQEISDARSYDLLEALATAIADELLQRFDAERVLVRVRKPDVRPGGLDGIAGVSVAKP